MWRFRNRKGVFVVLFGILFMTLMGAAAVSIDFARIWAMRNELQTSADAGALAGAVQIGTTPGDTVQIKAAAATYLTKNTAMGVAVVVDSVIPGNWIDDPVPPDSNWHPRTPPWNAVRTVARHSTNGLIMSAFGITAPSVRARATAWADAPIAIDACIRPVAVPYVELMYKINLHRFPGAGDNNSIEKLSRPFDQTADIQALREMTDDERTFTLKLGGGGKAGPLPGAGSPGNYQAIDFPKVYDAATGQSYPDGSPVSGGKAFKEGMAGTRCYGLAPGDIVDTEPGGMVGPTLQGMAEVCVGSGNNDNDCKGADGNIGVPVRAAFEFCTSNCNGRTTVDIKLLGSFNLTQVYQKKTGDFDMAQIVGVFQPINVTGPVGGVGSTLVTIILVK